MSKPHLLRLSFNSALSLLALCLCSALLYGCGGSAADNHSNGVAKLTSQLTAQADRWDKAIINKDRAAIEANMADDFRQIDGSGNIETKTSFLKGIVADDLVINPYTVEEMDIRIYGDVALLSGRTRMTGLSEGVPFKSHYRYIDIYVRRDEQWKIVSVQISTIPQR